MYCHPAVVGVIWYRMGRACWLRRRNPLWRLLLVIVRLGYPLVRVYSGLELSPRTEVGPGLYVAHFGPSVIHPDAVIGRNLTIMHGVTIGASATGVPRLGDNVGIGTGAVIIGSVTIGDNVNIGANAVVTRSVDSHCTVVGIPAHPAHTT
jgi:serine O-acetyltransferase